LGLYYLLADPYNYIASQNLLGLFLGSVVLMIGGYFDDKYALPSWITWMFPALAVSVVMLFGVGSNFTLISNPIGLPVRLDYLLFV
jgi:hypothetical protein